MGAEWVPFFGPLISLVAATVSRCWQCNNLGPVSAGWRLLISPSMQTIERGGKAMRTSCLNRHHKDEKVPSRQLGTGQFPHDDNPTSQDLSRNQRSALTIFEY